ncbi:hypothetical protein FACS1894188_05020 [Clostridia bacterium]|nr:hypothetical protein FACS1894188_05020 [Clostridia bacterium]
MGKNQQEPLQVEFHNPNTIEDTANFLIKIIAEKLVEKMIGDRGKERV